MHRFLPVFLMVALLGLAGCDSPDSPENQRAVRQAVEKNINAYLNRDWREWCSGLAGWSRARVADSPPGARPAWSRIKYCQDRMEGLWRTNKAQITASNQIYRGLKKQLQKAKIEIAGADSDQEATDWIISRAKVQMPGITGSVVELVQVGGSKDGDYARLVPLSRDMVPGRWYIVTN